VDEAGKMIYELWIRWRTRLSRGGCGGCGKPGNHVDEDDRE